MAALLGATPPLMSATPWFESVPADGPQSITVAPANVGDLVIEREFWEYRAADSDGYHFEYPYEEWFSSAKFEGATQVADQTGMPHDVMAIRWTMMDPPDIDDTMSFVQRTATNAYCGPWTYDSTSFVDLDTRDLVRLDWHYVDPCGVASGADPQRTEGYSLGMLGPNYGVTANVAVFDSPWLVAALQGRTLQVGQDLGDVAAARKMALIDRYSSEGKVQIDSWMRVTGAETHGPHEGFAVHASLTFSFESHPGSYRTFQSWNETYLLTPDLPWTVWRERDVTYHYEDDTGYSYDEVVRSGSEFVRREAGNTPIAWGTNGLGAWGPPVEPEWSPGAHPVSGRSWTHPHRVEAALQSVTADPALVRFLAWKQLNPGALLVGFTFAPTVTTPASASWLDTASTTWTFTYAAPGSETGYRVASTRHPNGAVTNAEGAWSELTFGPAERVPVEGMPYDRQITLSLGLEMWPAVISGATSHPINYLSWAYGTYNDPYYVLEGYGRFQPHKNMHRLAVAEVVATPAENEYQRLASAASGMLVINSTTGVTERTLFAEWGDPVSRTLDRGGAVAAMEAAPAPDRRTLSLVSGGALAAVGILAIVYAIIKALAAPTISLLPAYAKVPRSAVLNHLFRDQLMQLIRQEPGISPPELHARVGGGWSTVIYHLGVLERNRLASSMLDGRHKRYFPAETMDWSKREAIAALRHERTRSFYEMINANPDVHQTLLREQSGLSQAATQWHLERLIKAGLVASERRGRRVHYRVTDLEASHTPIAAS